MCLRFLLEHLLTPNLIAHLFRKQQSSPLAAMFMASSLESILKEMSILVSWMYKTLVTLNARSNGDPLKSSLRTVISNLLQVFPLAATCTIRSLLDTSFALLLSSVEGSSLYLVNERI